MTEIDKNELDVLVDRTLTTYPCKTFVQPIESLRYVIGKEMLKVIDSMTEQNVFIGNPRTCFIIEQMMKVKKARLANPGHDLMTNLADEKHKAVAEDETRLENWDSNRDVIEVIEFNHWLNSTKEWGYDSHYDDYTISDKYLISLQKYSMWEYTTKRHFIFEWESFFRRIGKMSKARQLKIRRMLDYGIYDVSNIKKILNNKLNHELVLKCIKIANIDIDTAIHMVKEGIDIDIIMAASITD